MISWLVLNFHPLSVNLTWESAGVTANGQIWTIWWVGYSHDAFEKSLTEFWLRGKATHCHDAIKFHLCSLAADFFFLKILYMVGERLRHITRIVTNVHTLHRSTPNWSLWTAKRTGNTMVLPLFAHAFSLNVTLLLSLIFEQPSYVPGGELLPLPRTALIHKTNKQIEVKNITF